MSGDQARVTALVAVPIDRAFELFTEDVDRWWRRGPRFRHLGELAGTLRLEGKAGGRFYEYGEGTAGPVEFEIGRVLAWEPPTGSSSAGETAISRRAKSRRWKCCSGR